MPLRPPAVSDSREYDWGLRSPAAGHDGGFLAEPWVGCGIALEGPMPSRTAAGGAAMKQLQVGDRVKILDGGKDDEGTVLDMDERTEMVVVYLGRHLGGWAFHRDDLRKVRAH